MERGANSVHKRLRAELRDYILAQYFGKSPILRAALSEQLDQEGVLYQKPFIESSPAYQTVPGGIQSANIPQWMRDYFTKLSEADLGVYPTPFCHQVSALEAAVAGEDLFVATGTGSGKTECFMWPILAKIADEARNRPHSWKTRGVRTIIMYPMNALVSDQVSRLRRLMGDKDGRFAGVLRECCGQDSRRPQFGMYTGRTPYPGLTPQTEQDRKLERTLRRMSFPQNDREEAYIQQLEKEGKIPAKADMAEYLSGLHNGRHIPDEEDAELITRFEMQQSCPDILITNYSMLEYMLLRPIEQNIWDSTKRWLHETPENKLLVVIDEAHMYRGSSGGEVALLLRRLLHKLNITRENVQFILTTASMPDTTEEDRAAVMQFAAELTAAQTKKDFRYLIGKRQELSHSSSKHIPFASLQSCAVEDFEPGSESHLPALNRFWSALGAPHFEQASQAYEWMYENLTEYDSFRALFQFCRGQAISIGELASGIFPDQDHEAALRAVEILLAIAPLAKNEKGTVLFPARMHMLFRGIKGVYACANERCGHAHSDGALTLGEVFLDDGQLTCPHCGSVVYELLNDRRCGALYFKGFIRKDTVRSEDGAYLWRYPGQVSAGMTEIHLYIPESDYQMPRRMGKNPILPCYLDVESGFLNLQDDAWLGSSKVRKLYYCRYAPKTEAQIFTFPTCPHCRHLLSSKQLTPFRTRGNQAFNNLIQTQFSLQNPVPGKDPERFPNEGRKVLLFSDSRQRAAKLARDMSESADLAAARQLFAVAIQDMEQQTVEHSMNELYDFFCLAAGQKHVQIFHDEQREKFFGDCAIAMQSYQRAQKRGREYTPRFSIANAPMKMQEFLIYLFAGGYNTLTDFAISWIEPTDQAMFDAMDCLEEAEIMVSEEEFLEVFNAWILSISDSGAALGHTIPDAIRQNIRATHNGYGLEKDWSFSKTILNILDLEEHELNIWRGILKENFLDAAQPDNGRLYVDLSRVKPRFNMEHTWFRCRRCSELTPYLLRGFCPCCGASDIHEMTEKDRQALAFWRRPIQNALQGEPIRVIDTEEHTAQLSHKDQRDDLWSKTEQYELRFQDLIQDNETPVDILSSTTTMEVGIDIGSLVAVGLRNIPPMRENYQQRAGRAGRRGASLSTIVTFCEDGPHDTLYYNDPVPMFRGDPRRPWIDIGSVKLLQRHLAIVAIQEYLAERKESLDRVAAAAFLDASVSDYLQFLREKPKSWYQNLLPEHADVDVAEFISLQEQEFNSLRQKRTAHPDLFRWVDGEDNKNAKSLLDSLYEEGMIPTYSFPKNVVSTYIMDANGQLRFEVSRGLDVAISEYAPGRAIVVDKQTYQIGGIFSPDSTRQKGRSLSPAQAYVLDSNYNKTLLQCGSCQWFGLDDQSLSTCPSCGGSLRHRPRHMLKPWGFAPKDGKEISEAQLEEAYSFSMPPQYSTVGDASSTKTISGWKKMRIAQRKNQQLIMLNPGKSDCGFVVCEDCGAAMPALTSDALKKIGRPYRLGFTQSPCRHNRTIEVDLGYDFLTDMLVLEFEMDREYVNSSPQNLWTSRAAQSLAEALRLTASKELDVEFTELVSGYRQRHGASANYIDVYLYDSLSSGAGYCTKIGEQIGAILQKVESQLMSCTCSSACYHCLKHYRNQPLHGILDRFAALQLLQWGKDGTAAAPISTEKQIDYLLPLKEILRHSGIELNVEYEIVTVQKGNQKKQLLVYPAMWVPPTDTGVIAVSDAELQFAKPYALDQIVR